MSYHSPNFDSREGQQVDMLVLHYTGMATAKEALERLCDPAAKVSAHYVVDEDGTVHALVPEDMRAWHAGISSWRGHSNINQRAIGIEIVNPGHEFGYRDFPKAQMEAVARLSKDILSRHPIPARNVVGHSDVAPARKQDPGERFDWRWLAKRGAGLWTDAASATDGGGLRGEINFSFVTTMPLPPYNEIQRMLSQYGYDCPQTGVLDEQTKQVILAFQRHFYPKRLTGIWDRECRAVLAALLAMV